MSNITLTWDSDGSIESFSVYRAEQSIDSSNLPTAIGTGITEKTYIDNDVIEGKTYFYRVASNKGTQQKVSDVITIIAKPGYVNYFYDSKNFTLINCSESALKFDEKNGGLQFSVNQTSAETIKLENSPTLQDFIAEFDYTRLTGTGQWANLAFVFRTNHWTSVTNGSSAYSLFFTNSFACLVLGTDSASSSEKWFARFAYTFVLNQKYKIKIKAKSALFTLFIDDIEVGSWTDNSHKQGQFGFRAWDDTTTLSVLIQNLSIKDDS